MAYSPNPPSEQHRPFTQLSSIVAYYHPKEKCVALTVWVQMRSDTPLRTSLDRLVLRGLVCEFGHWLFAEHSIGEQPIKGFLDSGAMARLSVAEALTNMCFARITSLNNIKVPYKLVFKF